jgi:hypothetical protein
LRWDDRRKGVAGTQALGNIDPLLPSLQLLVVDLLEAAVLFELVVLVVIVEIQLAHLVETTRKQAPGTVPSGIALEPPCPPRVGAGANGEATEAARRGPARVQM